jgi:hypothetical protein
MEKREVSNASNFTHYRCNRENLPNLSLDAQNQRGTSPRAILRSFSSGIGSALGILSPE